MIEKGAKMGEDVELIKGAESRAEEKLVSILILQFTALLILCCFLFGFLLLRDFHGLSFHLGDRDLIPFFIYFCVYQKTTSQEIDGKRIKKFKRRKR